MRFSKMTRRTFLKASGIGLAANAVAPVVAPLQALAAAGKALRVGVLVPRSAFNPLQGENFVTGIKTYLRQFNIPLDLSVHPFDLSLVASSAQKLLDVERVDLVIALIGANLAERLRPIFEQTGVLLLVADVGANAMRPDETSPALVYHSLNLWQLNWAAGAYAVRQFGAKALLAASLYDSGYDSLYATQLGIEYAGGSVTETIISHLPSQNDRLARTLDAIRSQQPDFVFAQYSGQESVEFLNAYTMADFSRDIPLVTSPFALHGHALDALGTRLVGVQSGMVWAKSLQHPANGDFTAAYRALSSAAADPLAVLGYDTMHLLQAAVSSAGSTRADRLAEALCSTSIDSPRGLLAFEPETQTFSAPLYLGNVGYSGWSAQNEVVATLDPVPLREVLPKFSQGSARTGWLNPYLF